MLCKWYGPSNHEDANYLRQKSVNMLEIYDPGREVLAITKMQARKLTYSDASTKKERFEEVRRDIQDTMAKEGQVSNCKLLSIRSISETNIMQQVLEAMVQVKVANLLET